MVSVPNGPALDSSSRCARLSSGQRHPKGQFDLERHGAGAPPPDVTVRVPQRILVLTAASWHNDATGEPVMRSLLACDN